MSARGRLMIFACLALAPRLVAAAPAVPAQSSPSSAPALPAPSALSSAPASPVSEARRRVYPALVNISAVKRFFDRGHARRSSAGGSGVIVSPDGYVLTNYHVASHATHILCRLPSGEEFEASVVTDDPLTDLSVLKLHLERRPTPGPVPFAKLGDPAGLEVGDQVLAMGNPMLLGSSMTLGIVSNPRRVFIRATADDIRDLDLEDGERTGLLTRWIQHDALILPGNSGGPLVDMKGEVVGINELGVGGVGFAIPANVAASVLAAARRTGEVERGWLGLSILPVQKAGLESGALVADVWPGSPARKAGLEPGDILLAIDGVAVNSRFFEEVPLVYQAIADLEPGRAVRLDLLRRGQKLTVHATVERMSRFLGEEEELPELGATMQQITPAMALFRRYPDASGLLITGLRPGYPLESAKPPLAAGDVLLAVGDAPTPSLGALRGALRHAGSGPWKVTLRRKREVLIAVVSANQEKPDSASTELPKAWLGVRTQVLTPELAQALGLGAARGLRISEVLPYTRAQAAGLRVGDVLTTIEGQKLTSSRPQDAHDLQRLMEELPVNQEMSLTLVRDGGQVTVRLLAEPEPKGADLAAKAQQADFEFAIREIVAADRMEEDLLPEGKGVLVSEVVEGGLASLAGLEIDDVVLSVNDQPVDGVDSWKTVMKGVLAQHPRYVKLFLRRGYKTHFVFLEPEWHEPAGANGRAGGAGAGGAGGAAAGVAGASGSGGDHP
jgi:serine protease Do